MITILTHALAIYGVTAIIVNGSIFNELRDYGRVKLPSFTIGGKFLFDCRMCVGAQLSLMDGGLSALSFLQTLAVMGLSYFLATQERD